jgi:hypothetical protein
MSIDDYEENQSRAKTVMWIVLYGAAIGLLLMLFTSISIIVRYVFSLGAIFVGIRFFSKFDKLSHRVWFIVLSLFFFMFFTLLSVIFLIMTGRIDLETYSP